MHVHVHMYTYVHMNVYRQSLEQLILQHRRLLCQQAHAETCHRAAPPRISRNVRLGRRLEPGPQLRALLLDLYIYVCASMYATKHIVYV